MQQRHGPDTRSAAESKASLTVPTPRHRTYAGASEGYDEQFERLLADAIITAIAEQSRVDDVNAIVLRTGEMVAALTTVLGTALTLCPDTHVPSRLRAMVEQIGKQLRRDVARAKAKGLGDAFLGGSSRWGEGNA
jgi:hypothetical protein